jgi:small subunit ribosomal protein S17
VKIFIGEVLSKKMAKTATVLVERMVIHPIYKKRVKKSKKYQVQDELGSEVGQKVRFVASKPYSKTKKWKITEIVERLATAKKLEPLADKREIKKEVVRGQKKGGKKS